MRLAVRVLSIVVAATLLTAPAGAEDWPDRIMERMEALQLPDEAQRCSRNCRMKSSAAPGTAG